MRDGACARGGVVHPAGVRLGVGDEFLHRLHRQAGIDGEHQRHRGGEDHRCEVLQRIERDPGIERRRDGDGRGVVEDGVAIRRSARRFRRADIAAGAGAVVDHHLLAHLIGELLREGARIDVGRTAWRESEDHADRLRGVLGRRNAHECQREDCKESSHRYSGFTPASRATFCQRAISPRMYSANFSGEVGAGSAPCLANCSLISAEASSLTVSRCSRSTMSFGVAAGTTSPCHELTSNPLYPSSETVGSSGATDERRSVVTARPRAFPPRTCGYREENGSNSTWSWPPMRSVMAGALPLYGTWFMRMPAAVEKYSTARWIELP